jgi:hypothetical protein
MVVGYLNSLFLNDSVKFCLFMQHYFICLFSFRYMYYYNLRNSFDASLLLQILDSGCNTGVILHLQQHLLSGVDVSRAESLRSISAKIIIFK